MKLDDSLTVVRSIENYDFRISKSKIWPSLVYLFEISFLTTLDIYKAYFKGCHTQKYRDQETYILCVKLLRLYAIEFCNRMLLDLYC